MAKQLKRQHSAREALRKRVLQQVREAGLVTVQSDRKIADIPFYSSVSGRNNRKAVVIN